MSEKGKILTFYSLVFAGCSHGRHWLKGPIPDLFILVAGSAATSWRRLGRDGSHGEVDILGSGLGHFEFRKTGQCEGDRLLFLMFSF